MLVRGIPPEWVGVRIGETDFGPCETMGIVIEGIIKVGLVWCEYKPAIPAISMCLAVDDHRAITKGIMRQAFSYAFDDLKVRRITNACSAKNLKAIAINRRAGMVQEGIMRCAHPDGSDLIIFGMLRHECKYLEQSWKTSIHNITQAS